MGATSCSNSIAGKANRKTIPGQDVVSTMEDMEFDKFIKPLETSLQVWRQSQEKKKNAAKKNAEEKNENNSGVGKSKSETSNKDGGKSNSSAKSENEIVKLDGSSEENKENEDDDSDEIQEIPA